MRQGLCYGLTMTWQEYTSPCPPSGLSVGRNTQVSQQSQNAVCEQRGKCRLSRHRSGGRAHVAPLQLQDGLQKPAELFLSPSADMTSVQQYGNTGHPVPGPIPPSLPKLAGPFPRSFWTPGMAEKLTL